MSQSHERGNQPAERRLFETFKPLAEVVFNIPQLRPSIVGKRVVTHKGPEKEDPWTHEVVVEREQENLDANLHHVAHQVHERGLHRLMTDVVEGKKSAVYIVGFGTLTILAAVGVGVEFGVRNGRDVRDLYNRIQPYLERLRHRAADQEQK